MAMTTLGEAFIEVKADLRPFTRDLRREVKAAITEVEKEMSAKLGKGVADGTEQGAKEGSRRARKHIDNELGNRKGWVNVIAALGSALDDGLSALPTEVKAAIVLGIGAAAIPAAAALGGLVSAAAGVLAVGLGVALVSQFEMVRSRWAEIVINMRERLVEAAHDFGPAVLTALDSIEAGLDRLLPTIKHIFDTSATFVDPLTDGLIAGISQFVESFGDSVEGMEGFIDALGEGIAIFGDAAGEALEILVSTGEDGQDALLDLIKVISDTLVSIALMIKFFSDLYGILRDINEVIPSLGALLFSSSREGSDAFHELSGAGADYSTIFDDVIKKTKDQEKAAKDAAKSERDLVRAMDEARDAAFSLIDANVAYEESLDNLQEILEKTGGRFDYESQRGRQSIKGIEDALRDAQRVAEERYATGELNADQARKLYKKEVDEIYKIAAAHGITKKELDKVFQRSIDLINLPNPDPDFWKKQTSQARELANQLQRALERAQRIQALASKGISVPWGGGMPEGMADGGIVDRDQIIRAGEGNRPEVIIPLTKPARAAQLAEQSGLLGMLGGMGSTMVQVYVGDEPLEQKMYRVVEGNQRVNSRQLFYGTRS